MAENKYQAPLIAHVIYRLGIGGLENGLVNLINQIPAEEYRHIIICLKGSTSFRERLTRKDVQVIDINKKEGQDWKSFWSFFWLLKKNKVDIVHTRNLATIEYQIPALLAGIKYRVHSEHGWDVFDPEGNNKKYQWLRRIISPLIHVFIPLSLQLQSYLIAKVKIPITKIRRICNGVDTQKFYPQAAKIQVDDCPFPNHKDNIYIGTVGRMHGVKDQITLVNAFIKLMQQHSELVGKIYLILVGDGPLREQAITLLDQNQLSQYVWLPGERKDIAQIMRSLDVFVLPSQAEGISNTILEAMASGLPVVATEVGGNPELVIENETGLLVPHSNPQSMAQALYTLISDKDKRQQLGDKAYQNVLAKFSIQVMVINYTSVYDSILAKRK